MAKHTPLQIPNDKQALPTVLSQWAAAINTRLRAIELAHDNVQQQVNTVVKKNNLVP